MLSKYESPIPEPTQGGDTSRQHDLNPDTTKHGLVTKYWLFLVAMPPILWRSLNDYDDKDLLFCCDTINKHFPLNSIYLLTVSILYFPVCLSVSRQISKFGDDHITHFTWFQVSSCNKISDILKFIIFKSLNLVTWIETCYLILQIQGSINNCSSNMVLKEKYSYGINFGLLQ